MFVSLSDTLELWKLEKESKMLTKVIKLQAAVLLTVASTYGTVEYAKPYVEEKLNFFFLTENAEKQGVVGIGVEGSVGSGIRIAPDIILTANHVIEHDALLAALFGVGGPVLAQKIKIYEQHAGKVARQPGTYEVAVHSQKLDFAILV